MPDNPLNPQPEPNMQLRLLLAFLLMGAILYLTPYLYKRYMPAPPPAANKTEQTAKTPAPAATPEPAAEEPPAPAPLAGQVAAASQESFTVQTALYKIVFSNQGATVRSWVLAKYKDSAGKPLELVPPGATKTAWPFSLAFPNQKPAADLNQVLWAAKPAPDGLGIDYEYSDGNVSARKSFRFERNSYLWQFSDDVSQGGKGLANLAQWRGGFGDMAVMNAAGQQRTLYYDLNGGKLNTKDAKSAKDGPVTDSGTYSFAGLEDNYFAAVAVPKAEGSIEIRTLADNLPGADGKPEPHVGAAIGGRAANQFTVFVGPKDLDLLKQIDPRLEQMVDFGWFSVIAKPLFLILNWLNDHVVHNYGWAIVVVTILINIAILPMRLKSMKSMKKMQMLKPQIDAINARYKGLGLRDPRKQEQNQEVMALYKQHGVNPMGGCLPMVLQIPLFFAFYKVLTVAIEMRGASWLWVTDLSQPEHLAIRVLPIAMTIAQFVMQKMTPNPPGTDPNQQKMMLFLPLIFGFMFYGVSSGLVLYWLTSNVVGILLQYFINKSMGVTPPPAAAVATAGKKRPGGRK
jgi:YidC/Oxa1 family membrane protein insertase